MYAHKGHQDIWTKAWLNRCSAILLYSLVHSVLIHHILHCSHVCPNIVWLPIPSSDTARIWQSLPCTDDLHSRFRAPAFQSSPRSWARSPCIATRWHPHIPGLLEMILLATFWNCLPIELCFQASRSGHLLKRVRHILFLYVWST